jgi:hypothetical protein
MIRLCSRSDSQTFTPEGSAIGAEINFSRCPIATNSLGQPNTQTGVINAGEFTFDRPPVAGIFNASFYGLTIGMVANPKKGGGIFRSQLNGALDMRERAIWIRCAEVTDGNIVAPSATGFQLGLDRAGPVRGSIAMRWVACRGLIHAIP